MRAVDLLARGIAPPDLRGRANRHDGAVLNRHRAGREDPEVWIDGERRLSGDDEVDALGLRRLCPSRARPGLHECDGDRDEKDASHDGPRTRTDAGAARTGAS